VRPAPFEYRRPESVEEALEILEQYGDEARLLAGGQSLVPMLNMRMARPSILVDINRISSLSEISKHDGKVSIGSTTRYRTVEQDHSLALPLLPLAMPLVAHRGVRNRGTVGGSLALSDPAAETPACCICVGAEVRVMSRDRGMRTILADDFVQGVYSTALEPDEMILAIDFKPAAQGQRFAIREVAPRHGDFAQIGLCASATLNESGFSNLNLVFFGFGDRPTTASQASSYIVQAGSIERDVLNAAGELLLEDLELLGSSELSASNQLHMAKTMLKRVIGDLHGSVEKCPTNNH
jgi:aerobic carbon-monoxide dehydrogenase medium subunit